MSFIQFITAATIYLVVPLIGFCFYLLLCLRMFLEDVARPPFGTYFILFATYGGLLVVLLTQAFCQWSGMASLAMFYLLLGAPPILCILAARLRSRRLLSRYHRAAFNASAAYLAIWLVTMTCSLLHALL